MKGKSSGIGASEKVRTNLLAEGRKERRRTRAKLLQSNRNRRKVCWRAAFTQMRDPSSSEVGEKENEIFIILSGGRRKRGHAQTRSFLTMQTKGEGEGRKLPTVRGLRRKAPRTTGYLRHGEKERP